MKNKIKVFLKNRYFFSFFLGSICAFSFAPFYLFPLAIVGFSGLFLLTENCKNKKDSFLIGWSFGFGQFLFGLYWISISLFTDISSYFWLLPFSLLLIPAILAIYTGLTILVCNWIIERKEIRQRWKKVLILSISWLLFEYLRGVLFTGFPWNLIGYSFGFSSALSQSASIFGVYGLSLIAIIFYSTPALLLNIKNLKSKLLFRRGDLIFIGCALVALVSMIIFGHNRLSNIKLKLIPNATFRLVQPNIAQKDKWGELGRYNAFTQNIKLTKLKGFREVDYVIWPETAVPYVIDPKISEDLLAQIALASPKDGFVITGALRAEFENDKQSLGNIWNSIFVIDKNGKVLSFYDKNHLVPFGEFIPFQRFLPFISKFTNGSLGFGSGAGLRTIKVNNKVPSFSPLICYEVIFPGEVINKAKPPQFLLNVTNDAWFGKSSGPQQHFDMAKMRAIEHGLPLLRVANTGISALIDPLGRVVKSIPLSKKGVVDVRLMKNIPQTIYEKNGNKLLFIIIIFMLIISIFIKFTDKNDKE